MTADDSCSLFHIRADWIVLQKLLLRMIPPCARTTIAAPSTRLKTERKFATSRRTTTPDALKALAITVTMAAPDIGSISFGFGLSCRYPALYEVGFHDWQLHSCP